LRFNSRPIVEGARPSSAAIARRDLRGAGDRGGAQLRPFDPESKGIVERRNQLFEDSAMPGRFSSGPADVFAQLAARLQIANAQTVCTSKAQQLELIDADQAARLAIQPRLAGANGSALPGTTTSASKRPTTRSTRPRSVATVGVTVIWSRSQQYASRPSRPPSRR